MLHAVLKRHTVPPGAVPLRIRTAQGFWGRLRGLMWTSGPAQGEALLLRHCASVHTCFLRAALDLVYLDRDGVAVRLAPQLRPWRFSWCREAVHTLELRAGAIAALGIVAGQRLLGDDA